MRVVASQFACVLVSLVVHGVLGASPAEQPLSTCLVEECQAAAGEAVAELAPQRRTKAALATSENLFLQMGGLASQQLASDVAPAEYAMGTCRPSGTFEADECCPAGHEQIATLEECSKAYEALLSTINHWGGNAPRHRRPSGCFLHLPNGSVHFNPNNVVGTEQAMIGDDEVICRKQATPAPTITSIGTITTTMAEVASESKSCGAPCIVREESHSCSARIQWVSKARSLALALSLINSQCLGQCACSADDFPWMQAGDNRSADVSGQELPCHTAQEGDKCFVAIAWATEHGMRLNPEHYGSLTANSSLEEVQGWFYSNVLGECGRPCKTGTGQRTARGWGRGQRKGRGQSRGLDQTCHTALPEEPCYEKVLATMAADDSGAPAVFEESTFRAFQSALFRRNRDDCPKPCRSNSTGRSKSRGARRGQNPTCHTALRGEPCFDKVLAVMTGNGSAAPADFKESTFKAFQTALFRRDLDGCPKPCRGTNSTSSDKTGGRGRGQVQNRTCRTVSQGEPCYAEVLAAMAGNGSGSPATFQESTFRAFQMAMHRRNPGSCPRPCRRGTSTGQATIRGQGTSQNRSCHSALLGEPCYDAILAAMPFNDSDTPAAFEESALRAFQLVVHWKSPKTCPKPCRRSSTGRAEGRDRTCHTALLGESCYDEVLAAMAGNGSSTPAAFDQPTFKAFQLALYRRSPKSCPRPCRGRKSAGKARGPTGNLTSAVGRMPDPAAAADLPSQ